MQVAEGTLGRVFVIRLEDDEKLPDSVEALAKEKSIHSALVLLVGGARDGTLVVGPESNTEPPQPMTRAFTDGHEILGVGTIFQAENGPQLHLHAALGRSDDTLVGCTRQGIHTYLVGEIVVLELTGFHASRALDPVSGFQLLKLGK